MDSPVSPNMDTCEKHREEILKSILNPVEPFIMKVQSLLVWESRLKSAILFIFVHVLFWFFSVFGCQIYFLISISLIITYFIKTWKRKIWPEIRVPPKEPEDTESWTPVHPRLLNVPEICKYLAQIWCSLSRMANSCLSFRQNHKFLFCVMSSCIFISLALLGHYIPGVVLLYITVISLMLWPSVLYHNLLQRFYLMFEPIFMKLDYTLKLKSKWSFKEKKSGNSRNGQDEDNGNTDTDSDDFCPSLDPVATAALARSITDSEDEEHDEDFIPDLETLPSIGHLDDTDDEILEPTIPRLASSASYGQSSIQFYPSHFGDTSESEDDQYTGDLNFPDVYEVQAQSPLDREVKRQQEEGMALLASSMVTQTISSMMNSAISGLNRMAASQTTGSKSDKVTYVKDKSDVDIQSENRRQGKTLPRQQASDSDFDIADEFEFLESYDIDDEEEQ